MLTKRRLIASSAALLIATAASAQASETLSGNLTADNGFVAFVSTDNSVLGVQIGSGGDWGATYGLTSTALSPGTYYLQVEGINWGGAGAIIGDFFIGTDEFLTNTAGWQASYNNNNTSVSAQPWVEPTGGVYSDGPNGVGPWGFRSGISGSADWIDASVSGLSACGNCTVDFSTQFTVPGGVPELTTWAMMGLGFAGLGFAGYRTSRRRAAVAA